jgi:hypothetical protein
MVVHGVDFEFDTVLELWLGLRILYVLCKIQSSSWQLSLLLQILLYIDHYLRIFWRQQELIKVRHRWFLTLCFIMTTTTIKTVIDR